MRWWAHHPIGTSEFALPAGTAVCVGKSPTTRFDGFLPFRRKGVGKFTTRPSVFDVLGPAIVGEWPTRLRMCVGKVTTAAFSSDGDCFQRFSALSHFSILFRSGFLS